MNNYSTIKAAFKSWANYRNVFLSEKHLKSLIIYAQAESIEKRAQMLFNNYDETNIDKHFNWMDINIEDSLLIIKTFNNRSRIVELNN